MNVKGIEENWKLLFELKFEKVLTWSRKYAACVNKYCIGGKSINLMCKKYKLFKVKKSTTDLR